MKAPIKWHIDSLQNLKESLKVQERIAAETEQHAEKLRQKILIYEQQVEEAKKKNLTEFDRDRFCKTKKRKTTVEGLISIIGEII